MEFIFREWEQAWEHSRHLESMRGQYLGFFFTVVLGVTAIAGPRLSNDSFRTASALLTVAALALGLQLLSGFLYLAISRLNTVMHYYQEIIVTIKRRMLEAGYATDLGSYLYPPRPRYGWAGTSGVSRYVLKVGLMAFPLVLAGTVVRSAHLTGLSTMTVVLTGAFVVTFVIGVLAVVGSASKTISSKSDSDDDNGRSVADAALSQGLDISERTPMT